VRAGSGAEVSALAFPGFDEEASEVRKARGAFFTPPDLCDYVVRWAVRNPEDRVLEPSCGEAAFLLSSGTRLRALGCASSDCEGQLSGSELHPESARAANRLLASRGLAAEIEVGDFFDRDPEPLYDAVVGNPPYVRYQDFSGEARSRSRAAALRAGVRLTRLASSWAAFTVHGALFLKPEGCLGLVLPAELLTVNYAADVRRFLMARFARVRLVLFTARVFPGVQEEVVLLLAEGAGPTDRCELYQVPDVAGLNAPELAVRSWKPDRPENKWTPSLIPSAAFETYVEATRSSAFSRLHDWGETTLGMVTGNNRYFAISRQRATELGLRESEMIAISPPGSRHLRGLSLSADRWDELTQAGEATLLFRPAADPSAYAVRYIEDGEALGVHRAYKCRVRTPWWRVPLVRPADVLVTYMNADTPRLCANEAGGHHLKSVHGLFLRPGLREMGMQLLPLGALNSITLLGAETVGRAYGGGMLKLEPREADLLPVPSAESLKAVEGPLAMHREDLVTALRDRRLQDAVTLVDGILLKSHLGLSPQDVSALHLAHMELRARRAARGTVAR
jgi:adenine-specific DNA-methyltransferase